jgi:hypothetical protein
MPDDPSMENARKAVERDRELLEKSRQQYGDRMKGKPTPTQEENDLAACGAHIAEHEDDGSGPDLVLEMVPREQRHLEAKPAQQGYQTRQATPERTATPPTQPHRPSHS